jgi:YbgC/YbaW family acyl-CoA thioester hydrolase
MITFKTKINFFDCDPAGILFYGNIFFFCHSAYEELIASFNLKINYWQNDEFVVPIIKSTADYLKPFKYGDELTIELYATELRESSFELNYKCSNQSKNVCAEVSTVHVLINKKTWQKKELTPEIKDGLRHHLTSN